MHPGPTTPPLLLTRVDAANAPHAAERSHHVPQRIVVELWHVYSRSCVSIVARTKAHCTNSVVATSLCFSICLKLSSPLAGHTKERPGDECQILFWTRHGCSLRIPDRTPGQAERQLAESCNLRTVALILTKACRPVSWTPMIMPRDRQLLVRIASLMESKGPLSAYGSLPGYPIHQDSRYALRNVAPRSAHSLTTLCWSRSPPPKSHKRRRIV